MSLPPRLAERLEADETAATTTKLTHRHVVETMHSDDRPFFSLQQIQRRVKPDVSKVTVRKRLDDLEERGVVATETFPDSLTLYYVDHPESEWPLSPEGKRALDEGEPARDSNPLAEFLHHPRVRLILREELLRSVAWAGLGFVGWAVLVSAGEGLPATVWTVVGLPVLTWASLTTGLVGVRLATGDKFRVQTRDGLQVVALTGAVLGAFWAAFSVFVLGWPPLAVAALYGLATAAALAYHSRRVLPAVESSGDE